MDEYEHINYSVFKNIYSEEVFLKPLLANRDVYTIVSALT